MRENYDHVIIDKGRMRVITFYKRSRVSVADGCEPIMKDRTLSIPFHITTEQEEEEKKEEKEKEKALVWVVNCHLQAGEQNSDRRLRQLSDALDSVRKKGTAWKQHTHNVVVCGDFNSDDAEMLSDNAAGQRITALTALLKQGTVPSNFTENGLVITKSGKKQGHGAFADSYETAYAVQQPPQSPPASLVVPCLIPRLLVATDSVGGIAPTPALEQCLRQFHRCYCSSSSSSSSSSEGSF
jgi:hypothetical protein